MSATAVQQPVRLAAHPPPVPSAPSVPTPRQRTNYGDFIDPQMVSWLQPTPRDAPLAEMRRRYERDGYVWIKNVMPRSDVYDFRQVYFHHIASTGILAEGTSPRDGIFNASLDPTKHQGLGATPDEELEASLDSLHADETYHSFLAHPTLRQMVRDLTGWKEEVLLKRGLVRHNAPGSKCPSGIHYDQLFLRAGDPTFVTGWVPIGDCAADGGGLMYLEDSCALGERIEKDFEERQEREQMPHAERINAFNRHMGAMGHLSHDAEQWAKEDGKGKRWLVANYEAGDVVFHKPFMIHSSSQNDDLKGRIRLATDLRFYEKGAKIDQRWSQPWNHKDGI